MTHIWTRTRNAAEVRLTGVTFDIGGGAIASAVHKNRAHAFEPDEMPAYNIHTGGEEVGSVTSDDTERMFELSVECWYSGLLLDDGLDAMAEAGQNAIEADHTLGGVLTRCQYNGADRERSGEGELRSGVVTLKFLCLGVTAHGNAGQLA